LYRLLRFVPGIFKRLKTKMLTSLEMRKIRMIIFWQGLATLEKLKIIGIGLLIILYYAFFAF
jgi:hypothetical protein